MTKFLSVLLLLLFMSVLSVEASIFIKSGERSSSWSSECMLGTKAKVQFMKYNEQDNKNIGISHIKLVIHEGGSCANDISLVFEQSFLYEEDPQGKYIYKIRRNPLINITKFSNDLPWFLKLDTCVNDIVTDPLLVNGVSKLRDFSKCNIGKFNGKECLYGGYCDLNNDWNTKIIDYWKAQRNRMNFIDPDTIEFRLDRYLPNILFYRN